MMIYHIMCSEKIDNMALTSFLDFVLFYSQVPSQKQYEKQRKKMFNR